MCWWIVTLLWPGHGDFSTSHECPHSRNLLWLQQSTVVWLEDPWLVNQTFGWSFWIVKSQHGIGKSSVKMDPKFKFSVLGVHSSCASWGGAVLWAQCALCRAAPQYFWVAWKKIWWFPSQSHKKRNACNWSCFSPKNMVVSSHCRILWYYAGTAIDHPIVRG